MFITFEGGEGAGKSTLIQNIRQELSKTAKVLYTREPGGTAFGDALRALLLQKKEGTKKDGTKKDGTKKDGTKKDGMTIGARAELFLFLASRVQHIEEVILPALKNNTIVLCDRFTDSTIAYQGAGRGLDAAYVSSSAALAAQGVIPDLTFYIDVDPKVGLARALARDVPDRFEAEEYAFHERVRQAFLDIAKKHPERVHVLDGTKSREALFQEAMQCLHASIEGL